MALEIYDGFKGDTLEKNITKLIQHIGKYLNINTASLDEFKRKILAKHNVKLISDTDIKDLIQLLEALFLADDKLGEYYHKAPNNIKIALDPLFKEFIKLQVLILLEKIVKPDVGCDGPLKDLTDIVENKIRIVNEILMGKLSNIASPSLDSTTPKPSSTMTPPNSVNSSTLTLSPSPIHGTPSPIVSPDSSTSSSTLSPSSLMSEPIKGPANTPEHVTSSPIVSPNSSNTDSSSGESKEPSSPIDKDRIIFPDFDEFLKNFGKVPIAKPQESKEASPSPVSVSDSFHSNESVHSRIPSPVSVSDSFHSQIESQEPVSTISSTTSTTYKDADTEEPYGLPQVINQLGLDFALQIDEIQEIITKNQHESADKLLQEENNKSISALSELMDNIYSYMDKFSKFRTIHDIHQNIEKYMTGLKSLREDNNLLQAESQIEDKEDKDKFTKFRNKTSTKIGTSRETWEALKHLVPHIQKKNTEDLIKQYANLKILLQIVYDFFNILDSNYKIYENCKDTKDISFLFKSLIFFINFQNFRIDVDNEKTKLDCSRIKLMCDKIDGIDGMKKKLKKLGEKMFEETKELIMNIVQPQGDNMAALSTKDNNEFIQIFYSLYKSEIDLEHGDIILPDDVIIKIKQALAKQSKYLKYKSKYLKLKQLLGS